MGSVNKMSNGLIKKFNTDSTSATIIAVNTSSTDTPGNSRVTSKIANVVDKTLAKKRMSKY